LSRNFRNQINHPMKTGSFKPKNSLLITRLIFLSMFTACIVFTIMVFTIRTGKYFFRIDSLAPFTLSPLILFCIAIPIGFLYSKKLLSKTGSNDSLQDKFLLYQKVLIIRLASCEGVALYSVVYLLITGNLFGILIAVAALFAMWTNFPNVDRINSLLNLTQSEIEQFQ
jgi:hypothetical protein